MAATGPYSAVQCSAVQCSAVQCSGGDRPIHTVHPSLNPPQCSAVLCCTVEEGEENQIVRPLGCEDDIWSAEMAGNQYLNKRTMILPQLSIQLGWKQLICKVV
jgi:hypothetical protein